VVVCLCCDCKEDCVQGSKQAVSRDEHSLFQNLQQLLLQNTGSGDFSPQRSDHLHLPSRHQRDLG
jgi:hypothetical protein